jgi:hypothetical protein
MGITVEYRLDWERYWAYGNERTGMGGNGNEKLIPAHLWSTRVVELISTCSFQFTLRHLSFIDVHCDYNYFLVV